MLSTFALSRNSKKMAAELVNSATSDKLAEMDWTKNIEICELAANDQKAAKDVVKAIKKKLGSSNSNTQLYAVMLLELLMNNIGERIHKLVTESGILPILVKIVKKKNDFPVRERIFLLLDATQTSLGGSSGKFPQYYTAYYDLVKAGVKFPQRAQTVSSDHPTTQTGNNRPLDRPTTLTSNNRPSDRPTTLTSNNRPSDRPTTQTSNNRPSDPARQPNRRTHSNGDVPSTRDKPALEPVAQPAPETSIIQKASNALDVLKDVLDVAAAQNPAAARDEFTLDLVEQCSFQKQRVMHLVMTSRNEKLVSQAIELNENLQNVLERHEAILSGRSDAGVTTSRSNNVVEPDKEEEEEQLFRRIRKGKACMRPENEQPERDLYEPSILGDRLNRPIIRPLSLEPRSEPNQPQQHPPVVVIPPPPAKHVERQKFFKENKLDGPGFGVSGHTRGLSLQLHSRNSSRSLGESLDSIE